MGWVLRQQDRRQSYRLGYAEGGLFTTDPDGAPVQSPFEFVSGGCYAMAGVKAHIGRLIAERDAPLGGEPARVAVLGYGFWQRHYGRDPAVLGRTIRADDLPLTIIGVTPPGFAGLQVDVAPDITVPATLLPTLGVGRPGATQVNYVVARLRADVTVPQARSRASAAWPAVQAETMPGGLSAVQQEEFRSSAVHVESLEHGFSPLREEHAHALALLGALAGLLLVLTVVNLSGLLLARTAAREHELAVRAAMGASGPRLAALVVAEGVVLAAGGAGAAIPFAYWASAALGRMLWTGTTPLTISLVPDWRVLGATAATAVIAGVAMSAVPAWLVARRQQTHWLRGVGVGARAGRWGRPLVLIQVAVSLVLVFGATLFVRSLANLNANRTGSAIDHLVLARLAPLPSGSDDATTPSYYPELIRRVSAVPGVRSASLSRLFPGISDEAAMFTKVAAAGVPLEASVGGAVVDAVSPGFCHGAGISLLRGRDFGWQDDSGSPNVAIVNVSAARRLFGSSDAVGRRIRIGADPSLQSVEVVGLVDDAMIGNVRAPHVPIVMCSVLQYPQFARYSAVVIRTDLPGEALTRAVQRAVATLGKDYVTDIRSANDLLRRSVAKDQVMATLLAAVWQRRRGHRVRRRIRRPWRSTCPVAGARLGCGWPSEPIGGAGRVR